VSLNGRTLVMGALFELNGLERRLAGEVAGGRRVVAFGDVAGAVREPGEGGALPQRPSADCLVVLAEELRPEIRATVAFFARAGVSS
jgi:hypothetical protein